MCICTYVCIHGQGIDLACNCNYAYSDYSGGHENKEKLQKKKKINQQKRSEKAKERTYPSTTWQIVVFKARINGHCF